MISKIERESKESDKLILDTLSDQYEAINKRFAKAKKDRDAIASTLSQAKSAAKPATPRASAAAPKKAAAAGKSEDASKTIRMNQPSSN